MRGYGWYSSGDTAFGGCSSGAATGTVWIMLGAAAQYGYVLGWGLAVIYWNEIKCKKLINDNNNSRFTNLYIVYYKNNTKQDM